MKSSAPHHAEPQQMPPMQPHFDAVVRARHSVRAFTNEPVPRGLLEELLALAACAPSNSNTQPWRVHAFAGEARQALVTALRASWLRDDLPPSPHFPPVLPEECGAWQADFGQRYYGQLGIARADDAARTAQSGRNFEFFGAPVGLIFTIDARLSPYSWTDFGMFLQTLMLAAQSRGLATCPQVSFARHAPVIRELLGLDDSRLVVCGMSLGYEEQAAPVNQLRMPRAAVESFSRFHGF